MTPRASRVIAVLLVLLAPAPALATTGTFLHLHEDRVDATGIWHTRYRHFVVPDAPQGVRLPWIEVLTPRMTLHTGDRVELRSGRRVRPAPDATGVRTTQTRSTLTPPAVQRGLLILVTLSDQTPATYSTQPWRDYLNGEVADFFAANSYGRYHLTFDVAGSYVLPISSTGCPWGAIGDYAERAATAAGFNVGAYDKLVYFFPRIAACPFSGLGTVGGTPGRAWLNASGLVLHELGHTLGLYHSHACPPPPLGQCAYREYGDTTDVMGGSTNGHFNPRQKERLGWLEAATAPPMPTVLASGEYVLDRYESSTPGAKALKIPRALGTAFYVKRTCGVPGCDNPTNLAPGVALYYLGGSFIDSYLLDMTPASADTRDVALLVGQTYTDPDQGIVVRLLAADVLVTRVQITVPGTPPPPPPPPPPTGTETLTLLGTSPVGREMRFNGTITGTQPLTATLDRLAVPARQITVDRVRKTWTVLVTGVLQGLHTFTATTGAAHVSTTFTVPR
jgi:hypothetical protein